MSRAGVGVEGHLSGDSPSEPVASSGNGSQNGSWTHPETPGEALLPPGDSSVRRGRKRRPRGDEVILTLQECLQVVSRVALKGNDRNKLAASEILLKWYGAIGAVDRKSKQQELAKLVAELAGSKVTLLPLVTPQTPDVSAMGSMSCGVGSENGPIDSTNGPSEVMETLTSSHPPPQAK